jgi:hypothetical protein
MSDKKHDKNKELGSFRVSTETGKILVRQHAHLRADVSRKGESIVNSNGVARAISGRQITMM